MLERKKNYARNTKTKPQINRRKKTEDKEGMHTRPRKKGLEAHDRSPIEGKA